MTIAASEQWPNAVVKGFEVPSGVSAQPWTDEETRVGAENRAKKALELGTAQLGVDPSTEELLGVGLEGGVFEADNGELWSTVWAVVVDTQGNVYAANGARIRVPESIAEPMRNGEEMGPLISRLTGQSDVKHKQGMFGVITQRFIDRTEEYSAIAKLALGLWFGREWEKGI